MTSQLEPLLHFKHPNNPTSRTEIKLEEFMNKQQLTLLCVERLPAAIMFDLDATLLGEKLISLYSDLSMNSPT